MVRLLGGVSKPGVQRAEAHGIAGRWPACRQVLGLWVAGGLPPSITRPVREVRPAAAMRQSFPDQSDHRAAFRHPRVSMPVLILLRGSRPKTIPRETGRRDPAVRTGVEDGHRVHSTLEIESFNFNTHGGIAALLEG